jgi:predicted dehydrogenase
MGNQGTASDGLRRSVEIIQSGALGAVKEVHVWTNRPIWPQAPAVTARLPEQTVPEYVHWDLFLGPAPERPYNAGYHPFKWRGWWDFGTGALGDMACHTANLPFMALKLGYPTKVSAESDAVNPETYPGWAKVTYEFPARGELPPVKFIWYEGKKDGKLVLPPKELLQGGRDFSGSGSLVVGEKGTLYCSDDYGSSRKLLPEKDFKDYVPPRPTLPRNGRGDDGMKREWVEAIRKNDPKIALSNFDYAGMLTEAVLLGNVAIRVGKPIEWDGPNLKITNLAEPGDFLARKYRTGWKL